ncbi:MAG TPA: GldG family protein [Candidatus Acidoferrales bacterium]|nr:GldG family protein [Candidatus Acidoferrales bacterium]
MRGPWRQWLLLLVTTSGLAACLGMAQVVLGHFGWRFDLTPDRIYTLSPHARQVLAGLSRDVRITAFVRSGDERNRQTEDLLRRVGAASSRVRTDLVDINRNPAVARQYGVGSYAGFVVECGNRRRQFENPSEPLMLAAILQVTRDSRRVVYFLGGHGEQDIKSPDRRRGYSLASLALTQELYDVRGLDLLHQTEVPRDADVVIIAGPQRDPIPLELDQLSAYIRRGGSILVMLEPRSTPALVDLLAHFGVRTDDTMVVDSENRLFAGDYVTLSVPGLSPRHPVSAALEAPPLFSGARPIGFTPAARGGVRGLEILSTAPSSWRTSDFEALHSGEAKFVDGRDLRGSQPVGVSLLVGSPHTADDAVAHLVVLGDADFASNFFLDSLGNKDLLVDSVNWLAGEDALLGARAQARTPGVNQFFLTDEQGREAFLLGTVVEPGIMLLIGLVVVVMRRWNG